MKGSARFINILGIISFTAVAGGLYLGLLYAPTEKTMGAVQRIFYFHLPIAWNSFIAFLIVFISGVIYLVNRSMKWDIVAYAAAEIGVLFSTLVLITGSIWARRAWNAWWVWEPRLTTMLVMWLIYLGYLMARGVIEGNERRARVSAVIGIAGFLNIPIVFMSIHWWRTMHPVLITRERMGLAAPMLVALVACLFAFTLLFFYLLFKRVRLGRIEYSLNELRTTLVRRP
jgi:heme exporter protein C